jgi:FMN-dependent NADH-azoreductase
MKTLLKIQASLFGARGQSSQLAERFIEDFRSRHGSVRVVTRDLAADPVPPLTLARFHALGTRYEDRTAEQQAVVRYSDRLIEEIKIADVIVLAVPMYNFTSPAGLHNYFDHIARAGITFRYTESGPEGLIKGKEVVVFVTRGGLHGSDHSQTVFLREFLAFIGLEDAKFVHAEGLAISDESRERSVLAARQEIAKLVPASAAAA